ncbi:MULTISPECIES: phosphotransferase [unclassified Microbacterium]|uniref:phosphotransferase n=1 Tax=unclassified Microbacterium TaxID=2609290 RepID=UPI000EAA9F67|nr:MULTISPECIES: phosphotransferase [unclassified Microbacterium]MBT2483849.1 phosphotransferase [Microbacterium sp. ISL-108]RKN66831.1 aminoglycoside phosphotransferase [Microbacterium sp. CGR2]
MDEEVLTGGNASGAVVRVGGTVRKQWSAATPSVHDFVTALRAHGVDAPEPRGRDEQGRQVIEFVPGTLALGDAPLMTSDLRRVGALIRSIHQASASYAPPKDASWLTAIPAPGDELVCHNDLAPWNLVRGERWVFIDWDAAAPSTRLWDLAYAAQAFTLSDVDREPESAARDLAALIAGYGADRSMREALPGAMQQRTAAMLALLERASSTGLEPWASMYADGHGEQWTNALRYVREHQALWTRALVEGGS